MGYVLSISLSGYFVFFAVSAVTAAIALLGLGIVTGSAGMIALCQLTFAAVGAWVVSLLNVMEAPGGFIVWLVAGGIAAGAAGILVGLPALRLRGVNLAVVTLGFAAAADVTLQQIQFPGSKDGIPVERPDAFSDDRQFFFFSVIVLVVCALGVFWLQRSRWGASWKSVAFSERGTAAVGQSVRTAKLTAFAVSAALGGVSGGLLAGQVQLPFPSSFTPIQSLALYVLAVMSGTQLIDMAVFGGIMWVLVPELLKRFGIPQDWGFVIFGALGVQALTSGTNLGEEIRNAWWKRRGRVAPRSGTTAPVEAAPASAGPGARGLDDRGGTHDGGSSPAAAPSPSSPLAAGTAGSGRPAHGLALAVDHLTVQFGALKALDDVNVEVPAGTVMGLIGPNGAGKSTFVDAISGFLPQATGTMSLGGTPLKGLSPTHRARLGLRRTFQQDRVPPSLTVGAYVRFVARRHVSDAELADVLGFFGCPSAGTRLSTADIGTRRLIEVAANVAAKPSVLVLDEPAAGLSHEEHVALGERLRTLPSTYGMSVVLIEHDLDLVRAVCSQLTVLDFGKVLASGPQDEVLANPAVIKAYMGETEML
ncbi:ATP-binding cassette domain-containing protein [Sinomonas sp. ASV322]|uniref:branched-chain amino acid ABC transporter ATP-binding protein/permease n=1 Tax=Sinomonas sp. ASV322 TaxID=3041920 RepID=UPI0027DAE095|nr:ATP-binding cassette domain-containing protein [Sinomonas sp. ASV322]MDQ4501693.1 ATP-binding cassette domain-containing protein [Sinomonas sp. ASV322]